MVVAVVLVLGIVGYFVFHALNPTQFPNLPAATRKGKVSVDELRGDKPKLVLALLIPGDPMSKAAVAVLKTQQEKNLGHANFAALLMADPAAAATYEEEAQLPFTVYSFEPNANPIEFNQMVNAVGGFKNRFYGGTVVVLNASRGIKKQVDGNELQGLAEAISDL
jgi:hypothetical protein